MPAQRPPGAPEVGLRAGHPSDAAALTRLFRQLGYQPSADWLRGQLARVDGSDRVVVAEAGGQVLAAGVLHVTPFLHQGGPVARVTSLVVAEQWRGRGVGRLLLNRLEQLAGELGCASIELTTNERRADAHRFYQGVGYTHDSRRYSKRLR